MQRLCGALGVVVVSVWASAAGQTPAKPPQPAPAPPSTDIYLLPLGGGLASIGSAKPVPVTTERGYDNQPAFTSDASTVLFTANRDGKQSDIWAWDRTTNRVRALWSTSEAEYSAALRGDGSYSVIRVEADSTQRLWRFDRNGANPRPIFTEIKPVGYQAWIDEEHVGLFVLGQPPTLQLARVSTGKADLVASNIGRSLHRVPGTRAISFVQREANDEYWVKQIDVDSRKIEPLVKVLADSQDRDVAWTPDGQTLLLSAGTKIYSWRRGDKDWTLLLDVTRFDLGSVTRMAVSPKSDAIAIVVAEPKR